MTPNEQKWLNHYNKLIEKSKNRDLNGYTERHHIIPKCMGGSDRYENLIYLTAREHYIAHQLLAKTYPYHRGLWLACILMTTDKHGNRINNRLYDWIRTKHSEMLKDYYSNPENHPMFKKNHTDEAKEKLRIAKTGITKEDNPNLANPCKGETKETCDWMAEAAEKRSKTMTGRTKETHPHIAEHAEKMRQIERTDEWRENGRKALLGSTKEKFPSKACKTKGQTKANNPAYAKSSEKMKKIPDSVRVQIYEMKVVQGLKTKVIFTWVLNQGYEVSEITVNRICRGY